MDKKIYAVIAVIIVVVAAVAVYFAVGNNNGNDNSDDEGLSIIARVNTDGSGLFLKAGENVSDYITVVNEEPNSGAYFGGEGEWIVFNPEAWGGKVIGTPGAATIQHVQLGQIAEAMGLNYAQYTVGQPTNSDTLYYIPSVSSYALFESTLNTTPALLGAIVWEPQYSVALQDGCVGIATTNQLFPGHTCCVVGADNAYVNSHQDETVRFMAAYIESVNRLNAAIQSGSGDAYDEVIQCALDNVAMPSGMSDEDKIAAIEAAFELVVYKYADSTEVSDNPLADLEADVADLAVQFYEGGQVSRSYSDLGFSSPEDLASKFVNESFIKDAMTYEKQDSYNTANITVAVIGGDIHQLAIHYGMELNIFEDYGINITISSQNNGPAVFTALSNGNAQFGFIGVPPMTINSMNSGAISA